MHFNMSHDISFVRVILFLSFNPYVVIGLHQSDLGLNSCVDEYLIYEEVTRNTTIAENCQALTITAYWCEICRNHEKVKIDQSYVPRYEACYQNMSDNAECHLATALPRCSHAIYTIEEQERPQLLSECFPKNFIDEHKRWE